MTFGFLQEIGYTSLEETEKDSTRLPSTTNGASASGLLMVMRTMSK